MTQTEPLMLYNTLKREKQVFIPQDPGRVTLYACGPTVYNFAHIGNARPAVIFDLLFRLLSNLYPKVIYARNITDVEDKIIRTVRETGETLAEVTGRYTEAFRGDLDALNVLRPGRASAFL